MSIITSSRNGLVVSANLVEDSNDIILISNQGTLVRTYVNEIRETSRSAIGVKLMNLKKNKKNYEVRTEKVTG